MRSTILHIAVINGRVSNKLSHEICCMVTSSTFQFNVIGNYDNRSSTFLVVDTSWWIYQVAQLARLVSVMEKISLRKALTSHVRRRTIFEPK